MTTAFRFFRRLNDDSTYKLGTAVQYPQGWRFLSNVSSHKGSRKFHSTMEKCVPRWVGYPDRCESEVVPIYDVPVYATVERAHAQG
jgi:hypothetical protein